jgi:hypothetical protein
MNIKIDPTFSKENQDFNKLLYEKLLDIHNKESTIEIHPCYSQETGDIIFLTVSDNGNDSVFRISKDSIYITAPG